MTGKVAYLLSVKELRMMQDAGRLISSEVMLRRKAGRQAAREKGRQVGRQEGTAESRGLCSTDDAAFVNSEPLSAGSHSHVHPRRYSDISQQWKMLSKL
jgi:hypothetical protein